MNRPWAGVAAFVVAAVMAGVAPLVHRGPAAGVATAEAAFPGWPASYEGRALTPLPLTDREAAFSRDFPGRIGRFHDGQREVIVRYVTTATRRLHPASDCLRGVGYAIMPLPARREASGAVSSCLLAKSDGHRMRVCETVRSVTPGGAKWPDVGAWYWAAVLEGAPGPWWSIVASEAVEGG